MISEEEIHIITLGDIFKNIETEEKAFKFLDYIKQLQQENEKLKLTYKDAKKILGQNHRLKQELTDYKERNEKAIELLKHYETIRGYYEYEECGYDEYNYEEDLKEELLEILDKKEVEEK